MSHLQRKYRSLERRRESKKMPKMPKLPEKVFYRILDDPGSEDQSRGKKHVKFQLLGEEDDTKTGVLSSDFSPVPARYCASSVCRARTRSIPCTWISRNAMMFGKKGIYLLPKYILSITLMFSESIERATNSLYK